MSPSHAQHLLHEVLKLTKRSISSVRPYDEVDVHPGAFIRADSPTVVRVSGEDGHGWCDYYGTDSKPWPTIEKALEDFATAHKCFWEWEDPGSIALYEA